MADNEYHFTTEWRFRADTREVAEILADGPDLARWWPSVYLKVHELEPGAPSGVGKVIDLYTKGWLPYTLRWQFRVTEVRQDGFALEAWGDFVGRGNWTFAQHGDWAHVRYDWDVRADKPLLRNLSFLLKPIFAANHRWAMEMGERSLELELARRRAGTPEERALVPAPPAATTASPLALGGAALAFVAGALLLRRRRG
jgi:hypothetical protein